jgi:cellulose synthase/poly-beta-1,6-N-acetylglucosamine synthase-like glycosyltransferase
MNLALKEVNSDLIASLDADSFVDKKALKYLVQHFQKEEVVAVTSAIKTLDSKNF